MISILKTTKGHNSVNNVGRVKIFVLFKLSNDVLYVCTKFWINVLNHFEIIEQTRFPN